MDNKSFFVDLGGLSYFPDEPMTGIPRTTLSLSKEYSDLAVYQGMNVNFMSLLHEDLAIPEFMREKTKLKPGQDKFLESQGILFLLDTYYFKYNFLNKLPINLSENYFIVDYIHDVMPLTRPEFFNVSEFRFKYLCLQSFRFADAIMSPSKYTCDEIVAYLTDNEESHIGNGLKLGYQYHGSDILFKKVDDCENPLGEAAKKPYFLMVGTVEYRKNHMVVLNAFEKLWEKGIEINLCIAGKLGWKVEAFIEKMSDHPERDKRFFFVNTPSDEELARIYKDSHCLIFASKDEGFGIPVVEAAHYKKPMLLSDIPVFHEIAGDNARYFAVDDEDALAESIEKFLKDERQGELNEDSSQIRPISWKESAIGILDSITNDNWYCTIYPDKTVEYRETLTD